MKFTKMHGLGNDYVYVDCFDQQVRDPARLAVQISDRHTGVGSDGLILIQPSKIAHARMEIYNADGSRAEMCGNGIRCLAKYLLEHQKVPCQPDASRQSLQIETDAGLRNLQATLEAGRVTSVSVDMGRASTAPDDLPANTDQPAIIDQPFHIDAQTLPVTRVTLPVTCVSVGNPHAVIFVDQLEAIDLSLVGPRVEQHSMFPQRINVHLVQVVTRGEMNLRSWERGSGLTRACGTGATAAVAAAVITHRTDRRVLVHLPGGDLHVEWAEDDHLWMTGPAEEVFTGEWPDES